MAKAQAVMRQAPTDIILGSSRARLGLVPEDYQAITGRPAYNLAFAGPAPSELAAYFRHALYVQPALHEVLLAVEYQQFVPTDEAALRALGFSTARLERRTLPVTDYLAHTFTATALSDSWETLLANRAHPDWRGYGPAGNDLALPWHQWQDAAGPAGAFEAYISLATRSHEPIFRYDPTGLAAIRAIRDACRAHGIHLTIATAPVHAVEEGLIYAHGHETDTERWRRDLAALTGYWDFGGCNEVTTVPIRAGMGYVDPTHYAPAVGRRMLERLYGGRPGRFGVWVDAGNVEAHLARLREARRAWLAQNPRLAQHLHAWPPMQRLLRAHP
jgi:hypothetical protein